VVDLSPLRACAVLVLLDAGHHGDAVAAVNRSKQSYALTPNVMTGR
jgi:hypothetical protein